MEWNGCNVLYVLNKGYEALDALNDLGKIDHFQRNQSLSIPWVWDRRQDKTCACGCGEPTRHKWSRLHGELCYRAINIIAYPGNSSAWFLLFILQRRKCRNCGVVKTSRHNFDLDHIIEVNEGGGGCFIDNLQLLCSDCHKLKTSLYAKKRAKDRKPTNPNQLKFF